MVIATALLQGGVCKTATSPSTTSTTTPVPTPSTTPGLSNGLALTLPMEWNSWNRFGDQIEEPLIKNTMDTRASNGLRDIGYVSINLDDGWQRYKSNRSHNPLELDPEKFPSGMKALADYAHANGFKLGIYSGPGQMTCAGYTGGEGYEKEDTSIFSLRGIDHLKYDSCCSSGEKAPRSGMEEISLKMSRVLLAQSHPIMYHFCPCG